MQYLTAIPSYGRDYKSAKDVRADWEAGKDFTISTLGADDGRQINKQDAQGIVLNIRYKKLASICQIKT